MRKTLLALSLVLATSAAAQAQINPNALNAPIPGGLNANTGALNPANPQVKPLPPANNGGGATVDSLTAAPPAVPPAPAAPVPPAAPPANPNAAPPAAPAPVPAAPVPPANPNANPNGNPSVTPNNPLPLPPAGGPQVGPGGNVNNGFGLGGNMSAADKQALIARLQAALTHLEQLLAQTQDPIKKAKIEKRIMKIKKVLAHLI